MITKEAWQKITYLVNEVVEIGLKLHVEEEMLKGSTGGDAFDGTVDGGWALNISVSLIVANDNGERTTLPGVMVGSSSILFIWLPWIMSSKRLKNFRMNLHIKRTQIDHLACLTMPKAVIHTPVKIFDNQRFP